MRRSDQMPESTSRWLGPIMFALGQSQDDIDVQALFDQATTTITKPDKPRRWWSLPPAAGEGERFERSVDWIRFGQLLRDALGMDDYPEVPPEGLDTRHEASKPPSS